MQAAGGAWPLIRPPLSSTRRAGAVRPDRDGPADGPTAPLAVWTGLLVAAAVVLLDQATKQLALGLLAAGREVAVVGGWFGWQLTFNPGGAFGFPAPSWFFLTVTVVVTAIVVHNLPRTDSIPQAAAFGLLLAGALGNALDRVLRAGGVGDPRFLHGHVVDFVALDLPVIGAFPRFNVADIAITTGFGLLLVGVLADLRRTRAGDGPGTAADPDRPGTASLRAR